MDPMTTTGIASKNVASVVSAVFREAEGIEAEGIQHMAELLRRDINKIDNNRYECPLTFTLPLAISPTTGSRSSIANYINNVKAAGHDLTISLHSLATKILFDDSHDEPRAVGVEYMVGEGLYSADGRYNASQNEEIRTVRATREVIVSGGTFNTPQILQLSGIGPRKKLEELDIPVLVDLPAVVSFPHILGVEPVRTVTKHLQGNFMQDNYEASVHVQAEVPWVENTNNPCTRRFDETDPCFVQWASNGTGPYSVGGGSFFLTWRSSVSWDNDADLFFLSVAGVSDTGFYPGFSQRTPAPDMWVSSIVKMQTSNPTGTVALRSKDPRQAPEINFNFFKEGSEADLQSLAEGVELLRRVYDDAGVPYKMLAPNPEVELKQAIMDEAFSHHATSSCRMGPAGDKDYCVDSKFRVNGVKNLRVVDASVFPRVPGAMPNGPTFTISRKAFKAILEDR
jgi:choline dehydrogenase